MKNKTQIKPFRAQVLDLEPRIDGEETRACKKWRSPFETGSKNTLVVGLRNAGNYTHNFKQRPIQIQAINTSQKTSVPLKTC